MQSDKKTQSPPAEAEKVLSEDEAEQQPARPAQAKKQGRRTRGSSIASSVVPSTTRGRTRSQSVFSYAGETLPSAEKPSGRRVKNEPSTPAEIPTDVAEEATPGPGRATRTRRGTVASQVPSTTGRRRRQTSTPASEAKHEEAHPTYEPPRNDVVYATRNFQRMSAVILNDITAHRHAGPFQKPVSAKDVEGYTDIIKRPQDLKSIKAAITAGSRAIAAASASAKELLSTDSPVGTPSKDASTLVLDKTPDLVPPKAIVNSAQLEKEVMRMFANAVMFNPGNEGIVADAREMSEDIAAKIRDWRGVERQVEEGRDGDDEEGTAGAATGAVEGAKEGKEGKHKRRKL